MSMIDTLISAVSIIVNESPMNVDSILPRYRLLERYVEWTDGDAARLRGAGDLGAASGSGGD